jgi:hypothetical protein
MSILRYKVGIKFIKSDFKYKNGNRVAAIVYVIGTISISRSERGKRKKKKEKRWIESGKKSRKERRKKDR